MEEIGTVTVARSVFRKKMYVYRCVRQPGYMLELFSNLAGDLYQCTQCRKFKKMRSVKIVNDAIVNGKMQPADGHHVLLRLFSEKIAINNESIKT